jgi:hypothetical protein
MALKFAILDLSLAFTSSISSPMPDRPILLIQCPSCQHANTPGERFCAVCGVPLHLKPCPKCGKVDDAAAKTCSACGTPFQTLGPDQYVLAADDRPAASGGTARQPDMSTTQPASLAPANRAWPLIIVALAAGGIPFLWMYRANMPLPKAWQAQGQNAAGSAVVPAPVQVPAAVVPPTASAVVSATAMPATVLAPAPSNESKDQAPGGDVAQVVSNETSQANDKLGPTAQAKTAPHRSPTVKPKPVAKPIAKPVPAGREAASPPRPCTEALAALDLCGPKPAGK